MSVRPTGRRLDHGSALERVVQEASADPIAGLQDENRNPRGQ